jgi:hypothetical protein
MDAMSAFEIVAMAEADGRFSPGVLALLNALAPFAHWGELDGVPAHVAGLFELHEREQVREYIANAARVFRKATTPAEVQP